MLADLYLGDPERALAAFEQYKTLTGEEKPVSGWIAELRQRLGMAAPKRPEAPQGAGGRSAAAGHAPAGARGHACQRRRGGRRAEVRRMIMRKRRANSFRGLAGAGLLAGLLVAGSALAQQNTPTAAPGGHATPRPDQLEPGVDTTKSAPMEPAPASSPAAAPAAAERTAATADACGGTGGRADARGGSQGHGCAGAEERCRGPQGPGPSGTGYDGRHR